MLKLSILTLTLLPVFAIANTITITGENISGTIPIGTSINKVISEGISLDVNSGTKVIAYLNEEFDGEQTEYKEGKYTNVTMKSFTVNRDINTAYSITFKDYTKSSETCLDLKYTNRRHELITTGKICQGETKKLLDSAPADFRIGDTIHYSIWKDDSSLVTGQITVQSKGELISSRRASAVRGVRAIAETPSHLRVGFTQ